MMLEYTHKTQPARKREIVTVPTSVEKPNRSSMSLMIPDGAELAKLATAASVLAKPTKYHRKAFDQFYAVSMSGKV